MSRRGLAQWGQDLAERHLASEGYLILDRNWGVPEGEIDLVAQDGETVVFVEVKTRRGTSYGSPEEAVTLTKRRKLRKAACAYLEDHGLFDVAWRIDVVAIEGRPPAVCRLDHYVNAVEGEAES